MSILVIIPARSGSKGLPGKNLREVGGMSLVARAVRAGRLFIQAAHLTDALLLVDTDSSEIAAEGRSWGARTSYLRPPDLAGDESSTVDVVLHAIDQFDDVETVVLLQPTSPLRRSDDILSCWNVFDRDTRPSVASITPTAHPFELAVSLENDGTLRWVVPLAADTVRRQAYPALFTLTGAVYIISTACLRQHRAFIIPGTTRGVRMERDCSVDIDTASDLQLADALVRVQREASIAIGGRTLGAGHRCLIIAEAGVNHNGDVSLAHQLVEVAADAGADAVKFQTFDADLLVAREAPKPAYQRRTADSESQHAMLKRLMLPQKAYRELQAHALQRGLMFLSTPFDEPSVDFLESIEVPAFKIPSGEIVNHCLLAHVARKRKPILLSTGMSTLEEVSAALEVLAAHGAKSVALLHCVSNYPTPPEECNLRAMDTLRAAFEVPVGWSDHTLGTTVSCAAVAAGAALLEKHFTLDRRLEGPDHAASLEPAELRSLVDAVRTTEAAFGTGRKQPAASEIEQLGFVRRSFHALIELLPGHVVAVTDLIALRPGTGIPPSALDRVVGRRVRRLVRAGDMIGEDDLA